MHILLGITGSVAAVKGPEIAVQLAKHHEVKVLLTRGGENFWHKAAEYDEKHFQAVTQLVDEGKLEIIHADKEWKDWNRMGDPVLHIDLREWADVFLIAPLSAHTLAKLANGLCDDTLSCVARAWDFGSPSRPVAKPLILAPAMNTAMWEHPLTQRQLEQMQSFTPKVQVVEPASKLLACGEVGMGALAAVDDIMEAVNRLSSNAN